ncbi:hypothetical protein KU6B_05010 [Mameliella alba]|nr:hypothetical protein KU6B_05010 [Mameliella alba]GGF64387.1 hypothetical protein GCM10011319_26760 [Mameliella alba]
MFGGGQAARGALEQPHAEVFLKLGDSRRGDRRRNPQVPTRCRHAAKFIDTHKSSDIVEIGHCSAIFDAAWY